MARSEDDMPLLEGGDDFPAGSFSLPSPPPGLREDVLGRTSRVIRWRARRRRLLATACLISLFAAGLLTGLAVRPETAGPEAGRPPGLESAPDPRSILAKVSGAPLPDRPRLLKEAGDRYLTLGNLEKALDCYRQVFELSPAEAKAGFSAEDTWLLASLKQSSEHRR